MYLLLKRLRIAYKYPVLSILFLAAFVEWFEYILMPLAFWPKLADYSQESINILVVGDPQLLGYRYSFPGIFGAICRWDADRYVRKTFVQAYGFVKPESVIFLGDNLDEGEVANDEDFNAYFQRFQYVFREVDFKKAIIVPGDNDIGGEGKPPQPFLEKRFNKYFRDDVFIRYKFLEFVKVNYITHSNYYQVSPKNSESFRIILSHIPLTPSLSTFVNKVIPFVKPHIILSAHDHKIQYIMAERKTGLIKQTPSLLDFTSRKFNISETILHEISVPTCSYRMGTPKMGYLVLQISKGGEVSLTVLWLPSRFRQLFTLLFLLIILSIYVLVCLLKKFVSRQNMNSIHNYYQMS